MKHKAADGIVGDLVAADVVKDRTCTAYPALKPDIERAGGCWKDSNQTLTDAQVDGHLVTAGAWPAHPEWLAKFLGLLGTRIEL